MGIENFKSQNIAAEKKNSGLFLVIYVTRYNASEVLRQIILRQLTKFYLSSNWINLENGESNNSREFQVGLKEYDFSVSITSIRLAIDVPLFNKN